MSDGQAVWLAILGCVVSAVLYGGILLAIILSPKGPPRLHPYMSPTRGAPTPTWTVPPVIIETAIPTEVTSVAR